MFSLVKNYKKLFLMCVRNNFEGDSWNWDPVDLKTQKLKELGKNGIEENNDELKDTKTVLQEILDYSNGSDKIAKVQLEEILNFLDNQISILNQKKQISDLAMDDSFSEYNSETLAFFYSSKSMFEDMNQKYFWEKQEVTQKTKQETTELSPEIEAEKNNNIPEWFVVNSDWYVTELPDWYDVDSETWIITSLSNGKKFDSTWKILETGWKKDLWKEMEKVWVNIKKELENIWDNIWENDESLNDMVWRIAEIFDDFFSEMSDENFSEFLDLFDKETEEWIKNIIEENKDILNTPDKIKDFKEIYTWFVNEFRNVILDRKITKQEFIDLFNNFWKKLFDFSEKYKIDKKILNEKFLKVSIDDETITPLEEMEVKNSDISINENTQVNESKEKIDFNIKEAINFYKWEKINASKSEITQIQKILEKNWFNPWTIDWIIWENTVTAIAKFQKENWLLVDWKAGTETLKKLILITSSETYKDFYKKTWVVEKKYKWEKINNDEFYSWKGEKWNSITLENLEKSRGGGR